MVFFLTFPLSKSIRLFHNTLPRNCFAYKYLFDIRYSYHILNSKCDCNIWCKYPPSTTFKPL